MKSEGTSPPFSLWASGIIDGEFCRNFHRFAMNTGQPIHDVVVCVPSIHRIRPSGCSL